MSNANLIKSSVQTSKYLSSPFGAFFNGENNGRKNTD